MKKIFLIFALLFAISFVSAQSEDIDIVITQTSAYDLKVPCFNNGSFCTGSAVCNITISNTQTGLLLINNTRMTNQGSFHNISLTKSQTSNLGQYTGAMTCTDSGIKGFSTFPILVSPSGQNDNSIKNIILLGGAVVAALLILSLGFKIEDPWVIVLGGFIIVALGLYSLLNGIAVYRNNLTHAMSIIVMTLGGYINVRTLIDVINGNL